MKTVVMIDHNSLKLASAGWNVDFRKMRALYVAGDELTAFHMFVVEVETNGTAHIRKMIDFVEYNGFRVHSMYVDATADHGAASEIAIAGRELIGEMAVEIVLAAKHYEHIVIYSGDSALVSAVRAAQRAGARVTIVHSMALCSDGLRRACDEFVELEQLMRPHIEAKRVGAV